MKKIIAVLLSAIMLLGVGVTAFAADSGSLSYETPFTSGTLGSKTYRIPALYTLADGSVIAGADMRYDHGSDSPNNIDTAIAISADGLNGWQYKVVNHFDDYADGYTEPGSASFIDSAIVQSPSGRIFLLTDVFPSDGGFLQSLKGSGYITVKGERKLALTTGDHSKGLDSFGYYIGEFLDGFAHIYERETLKTTGYMVDSEYNLYKNGEPLMMKQHGSEEMVQQNVFYKDAVLTVYRTAYLWLRYSDDNGATWSAPSILSEQVKFDDEKFLGVGPGRGFVTKVDGKDRIIFCVYDNKFRENVSTIYSDDDGITWKRGSETMIKLAVGKTSEAQIVSLPDGTLRMYSRNNNNYIAYADSTDGGVTWTTFKADANLKGHGNCMTSFINTSKTIDGKQVILGAFASDTQNRADGIIRVGTVNEDKSVNWLSTYHLNQNFFAYSCMTELKDGSIAILYENEPSQFAYKVLTLSPDGNLSEINGANIEYKADDSFLKKLLNFVQDILLKLFLALDLI